MAQFDSPQSPSFRFNAMDSYCDSDLRESEPMVKMVGLRNSAQMIVSVESPNVVLKADPGVHDLLGYTAEEICGRSIKILHGPKTDSVILHSAIKNAAVYQTCTVQATLYGRSGQGRIVMATCSPYQSGDGSFLGCLLEIENSEAITLKQALADDQTAKSIVNASRPHNIETVSAQFSDLFGLNQSQVLGRTLRVIHGPHTQTQRWMALFEAASCGRRASDRLSTCSSACVEVLTDVTCTPIVESLTGRVSHFLVEFQPSIDEPRSALSAGNEGFLNRWLAAENEAAASVRADCSSSDAHLSYSTHHSEARQDDHSATYPAHRHDSMEGLASQDPSPIFPPFRPGNAGAVYWGQGQNHVESTKWPNARALYGFAGVCPNPFTFPTASDSRSPCPSPSTFFSSSSLGGGAVATSTICPRRKVPASDGAGGDGPPTPVAITLEVLESCSEIPLYEAAKRMVRNLWRISICIRRPARAACRCAATGYVPRFASHHCLDVGDDSDVIIYMQGVSSTALKKACRKLGVQRWPYRRDAQPAGAPSPICEFAESYVRR